MYSPYLFGRQFELLAMRAIIQEGGSLTALLPVVEPVVINTRDLFRCMEVFGQAGHKIVVVINPTQYQFADNDAARQKLRSDSKVLFEKYPTLYPGYRINQHTTLTNVSAFRKLYPKKSVSLLYSSPSFSDAELAKLTGDKSIEYHILLDGNATVGQIDLLKEAKLIDIRDHFKRLPRNADYAGTELYSDRFRLVGKSISGYGDYTVTGNRLEIGGGKPGAVTIHASYQHPKSKAVWIEHFVSDETDRDLGDPASKFLEAARKLVRQLGQRSIEFGDNWGLRAYKQHVAQNTFPGLGKNKEHQIHHHVRLMLDAVGTK